LGFFWVRGINSFMAILRIVCHFGCEPTRWLGKWQGRAMGGASRICHYPDNGLPANFNLDTGFIGFDFDFKFYGYLIGHLDVHFDPFL
jgi:hypothetical protein